MRIGFNPNKDKVQSPVDFFHQVIVPVYIPNEEGYFKDSFTILKHCLESLFKTSHPKTFFTVVNNGCSNEIACYLDVLYQKGLIHELIHTTNIGKLNAILKGLMGHNFSLITITDADVLFLNDWQKSTYDIFETFPKTGAVSTTPNSKMFRYYTVNVLCEKGLSRQLRFTKVINREAMQAFADSVGNSNLYNKHHLDKYLTLSKGNIKAVIGAGHFVATYRGTVFDNLKQRNSLYSLGGNSEECILDKPVVENGYWRLSTEDNYSYHMGNTIEDWMFKKVADLKENTNEYDMIPKLERVYSNDIVNGFKNNVFSRILFRKPIWKLFLRLKGLSKEEANKY